MAIYRCHIHTRPGRERHWKRIFKRAHLKFVTLGPETLYVDMKADSERDAVMRISTKLIDKHRTDFMPPGAYVGKYFHCERRAKRG